MTRNYQNVMDRTITIQGNLHELVRGEEQRLVNELTPVVREQSVTLDMRHIERIDAAGIAVLISLYGEARYGWARVRDRQCIASRLPRFLNWSASIAF